MSWKRWIAAAVLSVHATSFAAAKPPDLPIDLRINLAGTESETPAPAAETPSSPSRAEDVFERAERQRERGQLAEARRGYQEAHLLAPTSRVGQQAIQRLRDIETPGNDFSEEQEPPVSQSFYRPIEQPRRVFDHTKPTHEDYLEMLRQTRPLETTPTVPDSY